MNGAEDGPVRVVELGFTDSSVGAERGDCVMTRRLPVLLLDVPFGKFGAESADGTVEIAFGEVRHG